MPVSTRTVRVPGGLEEHAQDRVATFKQEVWECALLGFVVLLEGRKCELRDSTEKMVQELDPLT